MAVSEEQERLQRVRRVAQETYSNSPDWATFYREILGLHGIVRRCYPTRQAMAEFERTEAYAEIQHMLAKLRQRAASAPDPEEPTRVVTIRLPKSLHDALRDEAHDRRTSMNRLCISKLLQFIDNDMVPADT